MEFPFKVHSTVIGMHDTAYPFSKVEIFPFIYQKKDKPPVDVCLTNNFTMEFIRTASIEEIGTAIKRMVVDIDKRIKEIEENHI